MLRKNLHRIKKEYNIDFTIVNGENSADGNGITRLSAEDLINIGADVITGGNHSFKRRESAELYEQNSNILRPDNIPNYNYGSGYCLFDLGKYSVAVVNLAGKIFLDRLGATEPLAAADRLIERARKDGAKIIIVDFHAEATSEKRALGFYLDSRVSAAFGTHTHVQTADIQILPGGTGYITDIGMTGPKQSVLGVQKEIIISRLKDGAQDKFELANGECMLNGCVFTVDEKTGLTKAAKLIYAE